MSNPGGVPMTVMLRLIAVLSIVVLSVPADAACKTIPYRFNTNGDTGFHTLRNNAVSGNIFTGVSVERRPAHGTLTVGGSAFQYHAQPGYHGEDSYTVK